MNPLFLLFGVLGLGIFGRNGGSETSSTALLSGSKTAKVTTGNGKKTTTTDTSDKDDIVPEISQPKDTSEPDSGPKGSSSDPEPAPEPEPEPEPDPVQTPQPEPDPEPEQDEGPTGTAPDPEPAPQPQPEPAPTTPPVSNPTPEAPSQSGGNGSDVGTTNQPVVADGTVSVVAGRVATLSPAGEDIASVRILSDVPNGNVTVNPDNTFALVMTTSDFTGNQSFTYEATHSNGSTTVHQVGLNVTRGLQDEGWGTGENHYMLATDADDRVTVEHGDNHVKVYVSGSNNALSLADIARLEGLPTSQITGSWLANHGGYGQSEDLALDPTAGEALWREVSPRFSETSNWLLFERGHEYGNLSDFVARGSGGESELHPLYVGAWGTGDRPEFTQQFNEGDGANNVVFQDLHFGQGVFLLQSENTIFDHVTFSGAGSAIQRSEGITLRNSEFIDGYAESPQNGSSWDPHGDREQGLYMGQNTNGVLLEQSLFDQNGWDPDYETNGGLPPSMFSQNIYFAASLSDVTVRDVISMRGSSFGAQIRSGGFIEDNLFLDNNAALTFVGGNYSNAGHVGQYTLATDNVITSGAHKEADLMGALAQGMTDGGQLSSLVDNIVAHLADPNNPSELGYKEWTHPALTVENTPYYNDTIVYNWQGARGLNSDPGSNNENVEGLDTNALDQTTIQLFTAQLLGDPNATISDLSDYLRAQADGALDDVVDSDLIIRFFQEGFGIAPDIRDSAETIRFVPDDLGEGVRWDNRLNWETEDLPGFYADDSVDLGGNDVVFGTNAAIDTLDLGPDGSLNAYGGRLDVNGGFTGDDNGSLNIEGAGQVWADGSDAEDLDITVASGRFANTGLFENADLTATGGQTILASDNAEFDLGASQTLAVFEAAAQVGFDGDDGGLAILDMHEDATLAFAANDGGLGTIEEFRSGAFDDAPNVQSGIDLGNATLNIDLAGLSSSAGSAFTLMDADEIVGVFDEALVNGLGSRNANIVVDYANDTVTLQLTSGNGSVSVETVGEESDVSSGEQALWNALTSGQGVLSETMQSQVPNDDDALADVA